MLPTPVEPGTEPDEAMVVLGRTVAVALQRRHGGRTEHDTGWRCALHRAAGQSGLDREVLQIADDIYATAAILAHPAVLRAYIAIADHTARSRAAASLLLGMLDRIDGDPCDPRR